MHSRKIIAQNTFFINKFKLVQNILKNWQERFKIKQTNINYL